MTYSAEQRDTALRYLARWNLNAQVAHEELYGCEDIYVPVSTLKSWKHTHRQRIREVWNEERLPQLQEIQRIRHIEQLQQQLETIKTIDKHLQHTQRYTRR